MVKKCEDCKWYPCMYSQKRDAILPCGSYSREQNGKV